MAAFPSLTATVKRIFDGERHVPERLDQFLLLLARLVVEDFFEILVLAGNGYGTGAQKLLRSMYELAVTARFLRAHPEELDNFIDFHWVATKKLFGAAERTFGAEFIPAEWRAEASANYESVKSRFERSDCEKCGTRRMAISWSKTDFVSMTKFAPHLQALLVPAYYGPLKFAHPNLSVLEPFIDVEHKTLVFDGKPTIDLADAAVKAAHVIVLDALRLVTDHFKLDEIAPDLAKCESQVTSAWSSRPIQPSDRQL